MSDHVTTRPITAADVNDWEIHHPAREIINGAWAEETEMAGKLHGDIGAALVAALYPFVKAHKLGKVYQDNTSYVLEGTKNNIITMRFPDVSFVSAGRVDSDDPGFYYLAPGLAIEIISPSEKDKVTAAKTADYLKHGTRQVWVVNPDEQQVSVYTPDGNSEIYHMGDIVPGGDVLPGFEVKVDEIFG